MKKIIIGLFLGLGLAVSVSAQEGPLWLRKNAISPDGEKVVFAYQGDIFVVDAKGGKALQLTSNQAYDSDPMWTKDGKSIVFSSFREKSKDIFITDAEGGAPKRLTTLPGNEVPLCTTADGYVLFSANIEMDAAYNGFPGDPQTYRVSLKGGKPELVTSLPMGNASVNAGNIVLYEDIKGYEDPFRKHHTSSVTRDIWKYEPKADKKANGLTINAEGTFTKLSGFKGEDRNPVFAADGRTYYYLSEQDGTLNVYKADINGGKAQQLTHFTGNPVRYLSVADDGTLAFSQNGELYTMKEGTEPQKLNIRLVKDKTYRDLEKTSVSGSPTSLAISNDGKEIAVVCRGDVFVTTVDYATAKRITNTPEQERNVSFSKDGRTLYYSSERNGHWGIYATTLKDKKDKGFTYAVEMEEELVTEPGETCFQPLVSPDGKWLAFLRNRTEIVVKNIKSGKEKSLLKDVNYSYTDGDQSFEWSPDSRYLICNYQADGGWNNEDVALIEVESGKITDLTESGYSDGNARWALKGKAMTWQSDKAGYKSHGSWGAERDIFLMFFDGQEYANWLRDKELEDIEKLGKTEKEEKKEEKDSVKAEKKPEKLELDLDGRKDRIVRLTKYSGRMGDYILSNDGKTLYYVVRLENSYDLCKMDVKKGSVTVVKKNCGGSIYPSADGKYFFLYTGSGITRYDMANGNTKSISFKGDYDYRPMAEREYIFNHIYKQVAEKFYDPDIHGIDWDGYRDNYSRFLPYITNDFDFQEMLSEFLGELNGSHTGARYRVRTGLTLGHLGIIIDREYAKDGIRIKEILHGGVMSNTAPKVKAGDVITAIDGVPVKKDDIWEELMTGKAGSKIQLTINGKEKIYIIPSYSDYTQLYKRWVRRNEEMVERLSGGQIGYVHVAGMDSDSFREVYSNLLGKYRTCKAVIVDTRHNGGGWLHDDLATLLSGKEYIRYTPRGQYVGSDPYSKWTKPSCVLIGEDNYSDASGFPYVYKTLGIGKLIGAPVPGTMTAVWWENQVNPSIVFGIPQVGALGVKEGRWLENMEIEPDILVYNDPASTLRGEDRQIEAAVKELMKEIK
ncbi:MAG: S41 family peptidase [Candidatus Cryptobacteroides sp.]